MEGNNTNFPYARTNKLYFGPGFVGQNQPIQPHSGIFPGFTGNPLLFNNFNALDFNSFPYQWQQPFPVPNITSQQPFAVPNIPSQPQYNAQSGNSVFNHFLADNLQTRAVTPDNVAPPVAQDNTVRDAEQPSTSSGFPPSSGDSIPIYQARVC